MAALLWAATTLVATNTFLGKFDAVDAQRVQLTLSRVRDAVQERQSQIANATKLWVLGEVATKQPSAASARGLLDTLDLNYVGLVDASGRLSNGFWRNVGTRNPDSFGSADEAMLAGLVAGLNPGESVSGIVETAFGPFLMAAQRLPAESASGGIGAVAGVFLDSQFQENLQRTLLNDVEFLPPTDSLRAMFSRVGADSMVPERGKDQSDVAAFGLLRDIKGAPALVFKVQEVRASYVAGNSNLRFFLGVTGAFGIIVVLLGTALVELLVTGRIRRLTVSAKRADQSGMDDLPRNLLHGGDEISALAKVTKSMVERLRASQLLYRTVVETQEELIARFKPDGTITFANEAFAQFFGRRAKGVIGRNLSEFFTKERVGEDILAGMPDAAHRSTERDLRVELEKGDVRWVQWTQRVIVGANKEAVEIQATGHDITLRMNYEMELQNARDAAEAADRSKSEFLAVMSHEVRTPMNGVLGFADLLANMPDLPPEARDYAETIVRSGSLLLRILDDILDFSRLEAGRLAIQKKPFSLGEMLREIVLLLTPGARNRGIDLRYEIEPSLPDRYLGDAGRLRQVMLNLAGNAIKFTEVGGVTLGARRGASGSIELFVRDTGCGIPAAQLESIFEPFVQVDSSSSRRHGGAGLGLAISKRLIDLMGGSMQVSSRMNEGTEFVADVPLEEAAPTSEAAGQSGPVADETFAGMHPLRILVAEDDRVNSKLIVTMLRKFGFQPLSADDGLAAVEIFQAERPDCILMDLQMPRMDGIAATARIREIEAADGLQRTFIMALTANTSPVDRERCMEVGMDDYLNKPVKRDALAQALSRVVRNNSHTRTSGQGPE